MSASKSYFAGANYRFLPTDHHHHRTLTTKDSTIMFELDESDIWNVQSPEFRKAAAAATTTYGRKPVAIGGGLDGAPSSLPVNVPDWSKILKHEYRQNRNNDFIEDEDEDEEEEESDRIPPHEFLARTRIASFSVHEGVGRTLKGRDLSRVRNAIWQKTGFQD